MPLFKRPAGPSPAGLVDIETIQEHSLTGNTQADLQQSEDSLRYNTICIGHKAPMDRTSTSASGPG